LADVVIGNVILTAALAVALLLFVASASGISTVYTLRIRETLLQGEAASVAQTIQQVYVIVNSSQIPSNTSFVVKTLGLPTQLDGYSYNLSVTVKPVQIKGGPSGSVDALTVSVTLLGAYASASSTVILGHNFQFPTQSVYGYSNPTLIVYKCVTSQQPSNPCYGVPQGTVVMKFG
jgi:hypothetical protein